MVDSVTVPNIVRFNVTVTHSNISYGSAHNVKVHDGSTQFSVYWGIESVGLAINDPNLQIVGDKIMTLSRTRLGIYSVSYNSPSNSHSTCRTVDIAPQGFWFGFGTVDKL